MNVPPFGTAYWYAGDGALRVECPHCPSAHAFIGYSPREAIAMLVDTCPGMARR